MQPLWVHILYILLSAGSKTVLIEIYPDKKACGIYYSIQHKQSKTYLLEAWIYYYSLNVQLGKYSDV